MEVSDTINLNPTLNLDDDQKVAADCILIRLAVKGIITHQQRDHIIRALLELPPITPEEEDREEAWLARIALTEEEKAAMHQRANERKAAQDALQNNL